MAWGYFFEFMRGILSRGIPGRLMGGANLAPKLTFVVKGYFNLQ
jgi:hypothetical protein